MRNMLSVFLFLLLIYGVSDKETEKSKSEPVTVMEGDSATLYTNLTEVLNDDTILWLFGPKDSILSQIRRKDDFTSVFFTDDARFTGRLQVDQKTGSLTIRNTRIRHSGQYKLSISRDKTMINIFNVTVNGVVVETDGVKSESVSVTEGESVTLHSNAEMHKDALMLWRFGDKGILLAKIDVETNETSLNNADERFRDRLKLDQTGSLTITDARIKDSGLYELQIRGIESSQRFILSVNAVPEPLLSSSAKAGMAIGVLVPVLLLVAAVLAVIYYRHRISKLKKRMCEENKSVKEGDSPTLKTSLAKIHGNDKIEWCYEAENNVIAEITKRESSKKMAGADGRFRSKLMLNDETGDLTISNIRTIHSGLYILKISSSCDTRSTTKTKYKRFIVTVSVRTFPVMAGDSVILKTGAEIQRDDLLLWTFGPENRLVVKTDSGTTSISESFRDRLELDHTNGSLTITNITNTDSGHFKLQIINSEQTTFRRFNVTVCGSTEERVSEEMPLSSGEVLDGGNEQQATSSV